jgi:serine/threonine-protein phosphatase Stp1
VAVAHSHDPDDTRLPPLPGRPVERAGPGGVGLHDVGLTVTGAAVTHAGRVRRINEDAILDRGDMAPGIGLWAVADGVGGAFAGDWASGLVVGALGAIAVPDSAAAYLGEVRQSLDRVNTQLRVEAAAAGGERVIASTVVCLMLFGARFCCAWAGDSRLYRLSTSGFRQVTRDHSEVQRLLDLGMLSPAAARTYPRRNVITRAVGAEASLQLDSVEDRVLPGDAFLLCSDGLTRTVRDSEIAAILQQHEPGGTVSALLALALERGAPDNVSIAAIKIAPDRDG